jgi:hypothetical protein
MSGNGIIYAYPTRTRQVVRDLGRFTRPAADRRPVTASTSQNPPPEPLGRATRLQIAPIRHEDPTRSYPLKNGDYRNQCDIINYADYAVARSVAVDMTAEHRQHA